MLISIITVCLNSKETIERTIQSVVNQEYRNWEYIFIDGGSTDGTLEIIKMYANRYTSISYISEKDKGISDAFNKGILKAKGEIVGIINADDWYEDHIFSIVVDNFKFGDVIHGNMRYWKGNEKDYIYFPNHHLLYKEMTMNHPSVFVKRSLYLSYGLFDLTYKYAMDYEIMLRFSRAGARFHYVDHILANMQNAGYSDRFWKKAVFETYQAKLKNGINPFKAKMYYFYQFFRSVISKMVQKYKLDFILTFYRKHFSIMTKEL